MIKNKLDFYNSLSKEEQKAGLIRFYIPEDDEEIYISGEHVWGWADEIERQKYRSETYTGTMKAILITSPLNFIGKLKKGDEVILYTYADSGDPDLDETWIKKELGKTYESKE